MLTVTVTLDVADHGRYADAAISRRVAESLRQLLEARDAVVTVGREPRHAEPAPTISSLTCGLTRREAEVLRAVGEHLTNAEIAARFFVSQRTVESHVSALLRKLGAANRRELARLAPDLLQPVSAPGTAAASDLGDGHG